MIAQAINKFEYATLSHYVVYKHPIKEKLKSL